MLYTSTLTLALFPPPDTTQREETWMGRISPLKRDWCPHLLFHYSATRQSQVRALAPLVLPVLGDTSAPFIPPSARPGHETLLFWHLVDLRPPFLLVFVFFCLSQIYILYDRWMAKIHCSTRPEVYGRLTCVIISAFTRWLSSFYSYTRLLVSFFVCLFEIYPCVQKFLSQFNLNFVIYTFFFPLSGPPKTPKWVARKNIL